MNLALVGGFVLVLGSLFIVGLMWLASGGAWQKKYDLYLAIVGESVTGLNQDAPVKFNGVAVGKVTDIRLDPTNPDRVRLLFAIERGTPIKVDTVAVLKTQGLTGIAYVELSGASPEAAVLRAVAPEPYPLIRTKPSLSARLENALTTVLTKLDHTTSNIDALLSDENRSALTSALTDIAAVSRGLATRTKTIDEGLANAARTFDNAARVSAQLAPVIERIARSAQAVETMGNEAALASQRAGQTMQAAGATIESVGTDVQRLSAETLPELQRLMGELAALSTSLRRLAEQTERNPASLLFGRGQVPPGPGESPLETARP